MSEAEDESPNYNHRHALIVQMAASGMLIKDIAQEVKLTTNRVSILLQRPEMQKRVTDAQEKYWGKGIRKRMERIAQKALDQIEILIDDPTAKCSTRLAASTYIVDQAVGKAQQNVAVQATVLGDLITQIDKMALRDVAQLALDAPKDAMDTFVEDLIPETLTVGAKREASEAGGISRGSIQESEGDSEEE